MLIVRSLPPRGAWIEIRYVEYLQSAFGVSLPPRGAWIEILNGTESAQAAPVRRSPRGERGLKWLGACEDTPENLVAPPAGSVD